MSSSGRDNTVNTATVTSGGGGVDTQYHDRYNTEAETLRSGAKEGAVEALLAVDRVGKRRNLTGARLDRSHRSPGHARTRLAHVVVVRLHLDRRLKSTPVVQKRGKKERFGPF